MASAFYSTLKNGNPSEALQIWGSLPTKPSVSEKNEEGWEPLHWAAQSGHTKLVAELINAGATLDSQTSQGFAPLYLSSRQGDEDSVSLLIGCGANLNLVDGHGQTALHRAAENNYPAVAILLITANADVNKQDMMGRTPLHWAASRDQAQVAELLLSNGAILKPTFGGEDPLHWASRSGCLAVIKTILNLNPDYNVNKKNERNESALTVAKTPEIHKVAHSDALGGDQGDHKIQNLEQGTEVVGVTRVQGKQPAKKITIKMKDRK